jgi:outer membrane receptor protein involved in Fe transport
MIHRLVWAWIALMALTLGETAQLSAQIQLASRAPRFVRISPVTRRLVDASHATILKREMSLSLERASLAEALDEISRTAGIKLIYSRDLVPLETPVTLQAATISLGAALTAVLFDTGLDVVLSSNGEMALMKKVPISALARAPTGSVGGRVTDAKTGAALTGATVVVEGTSRITTTDNDGRYRIAELAPGTYTVRARYIGYAPGTAPVTIDPDQEAKADFALEKSVQQLNEVVTTGTVVPTEVKALPTPVSVINEEDIALQRPRTVQELFRHAVPGAVSWDYAGSPNYTAFSVRGASTLSGQVGQMKVFVDGIEAAQISLSALDPASIERVEVIRGPQAAAIYGSDAIGGVIQVFTKRGDPSLTRPQANAEASLGAAQTPYDGFGSVLKQQYRASIRGGDSDVSYSLGGGYVYTADYLPAGEISRQSNPTVYGGLRFARGIVSVDFSGRYYVQNNPIVINPIFLGVGFEFYSKPMFQPQQYQNQTAGARLGLALKPWWHHTFTVGIDRVTQDVAQERARLTNPDDTLLQVFNQNWTKASVAYNTSIEGALGANVSGSVTAGFDHYSLPATRFSAFGASSRGSFTNASVSRTITYNTGYYGQVQLNLRDRLFLTGGVRAEENNNFGDSLGTPLSPRAGISYVHPVGKSTLKLRASWGRAIRAPAPGQKLGFVSSSSVTLESPDLGPERQHGWDAGLEAAFGERASLSFTYYNQAADNLIQFVLLQSTPVRTQQAQNVGRVKNRGVEAEVTLAAGPVQLKGQYGYARARVDQLAPNYSGDLRIGDQTLDAPRHSAGASLSATPYHGTTVTGGMTYVGSWRDYDYIAMFKCFGGTGPCQTSDRDYIITYPSFVKLRASVFQQLTRFMSGFVSIDNITNNEAYEADNFGPVFGRTSTIGIQFIY